jgi:hypothetical protein
MIGLASGSSECVFSQCDSSPVLHGYMCPSIARSSGGDFQAKQQDLFVMLRSPSPQAAYYKGDG